MPEKPNTLTVIIPTFNVEQYLDGQLTQIENWADEVLICDSFSTDTTLEIAENHGIKVIQHQYINSAIQKNWAIPQAQSEWVMILDSDEWLEEELKIDISEFLKQVPDEVEMAWIPRKNLFWGKWMRYASSYPDKQSRLFRRDKGRYDGREVHSHVEVPGQTVELKHHIIHDDFTDIASWWLKANRYLRYEKDEYIKRGRTWTFRRQYIYPWVLFFQRFILGRGFMHGFPGFFDAFLKSMYYFMIQAKLYEHELAQKREIREKSANPH